MLRRALFVGVGFLLVMILGIVACPAGPTPGEPIEIVAADQYGATSPMVAGLMTALDSVAEQSEGRIKITYFHSATLLTREQLLPGILDGTADVVLLGYHDYPGRFPLTDVMDLCPAHLTAKGAVVDREFLKKYLMDEWKDVKVLWLNPAPANAAMTKQPVRSLDDLEGLRIQAIGMHAITLAALGASTQTIPWGDVSDALSRGVLDGVYALPYALKTLKWGDVVQYSTTLGLHAGRSAAVMNLETYNALPQDIKKLFDECYDWVPEVTAQNVDALIQEGHEYLREQGGEVIELSPEQLAELRRIAMALNEDWAAELEAKGIPAKKMLEERYKFLKEYMPEVFK